MDIRRTHPGKLRVVRLFILIRFGIMRHCRHLPLVKLSCRNISQNLVRNNETRKSMITSIDPLERDHFNRLASTWWNVNGPQRILHKMNLLRMDFINSTIKSNLDLNQGLSGDEKLYIPGYSVENNLPEEVSSEINREIEERRDEIYSQLELSCLDVGCGGGILSESLARLPIVSSVKGIDLSNEVLDVAKNHKTFDPILADKLSYELKAIEEIPENEQFDIVTVFEMLEHVEYPSSVLKSALSHVKPGGWCFVSTINRDFISWFTTIFMGEYVLKIVPVGTHTYSKYIDCQEIEDWFQTEFPKDFKVVNTKGCIYLPLHGWEFTNNKDIGNYFIAIKRADSVNE